MSTDVDICYTNGETVANFPQGLGQACILLPHRDRTVSSPESKAPPSACDSSHKTAGFPGLAAGVLPSMLNIQTNWAHSHVKCLSLRLRFPEQVLFVGLCFRGDSGWTPS